MRRRKKEKTQNFRQRPGEKTPHFIARRLPRTFEYVIYAGKPDPSLAGPAAARGTRMRRVTPENVEEVAVFRKPGVVQLVCKYVSVDGCTGLLARLGGKAAGYALPTAVTDWPRLVRRVWANPGEVGLRPAGRPEMIEASGRAVLRLRHGTDRKRQTKKREQRID